MSSLIECPSPRCRAADLADLKGAAHNLTTVTLFFHYSKTPALGNLLLSNVTMHV